MADNNLTFPPLLTPAICGGDVDKYLAIVYKKFEMDFIDSKPNFPKRVGLKHMPVKNGKEATFWHLVEKGENEHTPEDERVACPRRLERIAWPRFMMEAYARNDDSIYWWIEARGSEERIHITPHDFSYLMVVADRGDYVLPWTGFPVERERQRKKLEKKWEEYHAAVKAAAIQKEEIEALKKLEPLS